MSGLNLLASYDSDSGSESEPTLATDKLNREERDDGNRAKASSSQGFFSALSSDTTDSEEESSKPQSITRVTEPGSLVNPFRENESKVRGKPVKSAEAQSVFSNPFTAAEMAEKSALEKHVKLAPRLEDVTVINGRRICWNYRKGRCRFGVGCVFAHDSEIMGRAQKRVYEVDLSEPSQSASVTDTVNAGKQVELRRKHPGLTEGLVPGKKVMKLYYKHKDQL